MSEFGGNWGDRDPMVEFDIAAESSLTTLTEEQAELLRLIERARTEGLMTMTVAEVDRLDQAVEDGVVTQDQLRRIA